MVSLVEMQYQQHFPQQQSQPLSLELLQKQQEQEEEEEKSKLPEQQSYLAAVSGNNYASQRATRRRLKRKQQHNRRNMQPAAMQAYRQLAGAATNNNNNYGTYVSGGPYTSYGSAPSGGEYPPSNVGYSSYHPGGQGTGFGEAPPHPPHTQQYQSHSPPPVYGPPPQPVYHAPAYKPVKTMPKKKKDHMATMNPTVMVMTVNGGRNRFNKLAEINSREQNAAAAVASSPALVAISQNSPQVVALDTSDLIAAAASPQHVVPSIVLEQTPYSKNNYIQNNNNNSNNTNNYNNIDSNTLVSSATQEYYYNNNKNDNINNAYSYNHHNIKNNVGIQQQLGHHQHASLFPNQRPRPEFYVDSKHSYSNISTSPGFISTFIRSKSLDKFQNYSSHEKMPVHRNHGEWERDRNRDIVRYVRPSHLENSYFSSLPATASPTAYWSLAAKTSSAADIFQHHDDDDDIDRRYIGRSKSSHVSDSYDAQYA